MKQRQCVEQNVQLVGEPETVVAFFPDTGQGEYVDGTEHGVQHQAGTSGHRSQQPKRHIRFLIRRETDFRHQAHQSFNRLCRHVVKVDQMAHPVSQSEKSCRASADL